MTSRIHFPEAVKRTVRQQCKFGCVLCGCPLYHYDHIVEYSEVEAHEASNIALLCGTHHDQKTRNQVPASAVRRAKNRVVAAGRRLRDGSIGLYFENNIRVSLGSNTIVALLSPENPFLPIVYVDDTVVLGLRFEDDMPLIYAKIYDRSNLLVLDIEDSEMRVGEHLWDVTYVGTLLTLKSGEGQVLLQIRFNPASGEIDVRRGKIYANGVGIRIANGNVIVLNDGSEFSHNFSHALGFAFGEQRDPELRRASYFMGARNIPRFTYEHESREENFLQPDSVEGAAGKVLHHDVNVVLTDLVQVGANGLIGIERQVFQSCRILGPAVVCAVGSFRFTRNRVDPRSLWDLDPTKSYIGLIPLTDCEFIDCEFENIGIAGSPADMAALRNSCGIAD